jgi:hypothetical protein
VAIAVTAIIVAIIIEAVVKGTAASAPAMMEVMVFIEAMPIMEVTGSADVAAAARPPVATSAPRVKAAILVLIDIFNLHPI